MKKFSFILALLLQIQLLSGFVHHSFPNPKLYPELDNFFKSVKSMQISDDHRAVLNNVSSFLLGSAVGDKESNVIYACPDNSFRSQAAQIFNQTLMGIYKYKKVKIFSCGNEKGSVSPDLLKALTDAGYKISAKDGGTTEIKYSDDLSPIFITSKKSDDPSLPKSGFMYVSLCSANESCPTMAGATFKYALDFKEPTASGDPSAEFKQIASEIYYASNKAYDSYH